jgi:hypothetical protein
LDGIKISENIGKITRYDSSFFADTKKTLIFLPVLMLRTKLWSGIN